MTVSSKCSECGRKLEDAGRAGGLCARCLLKLALSQPAQDAFSGVATMVADTSHTRVIDPEAEGAGHQFGPFRTIRLLGAGGMGFVYLAQQEHPIRRQVALKVIKPGMD